MTRHNGVNSTLSLGGLEKGALAFVPSRNFLVANSEYVSILTNV